MPHSWSTSRASAVAVPSGVVAVQVMPAGLRRRRVGRHARASRRSRPRRGPGRRRRPRRPPSSAGGASSGRVCRACRGARAERLDRAQRAARAGHRAAQLGRDRLVGEAGPGRKSSGCRSGRLGSPGAGAGSTAAGRVPARSGGRPRTGRRQAVGEVVQRDLVEHAGQRGEPDQLGAAGVAAAEVRLELEALLRVERAEQVRAEGDGVRAGHGSVTPRSSSASRSARSA